MAKKRFSISKKLRIFVAVTVFVVSLAIAILSYCINVTQIDSYFKRMAFDSAKNFASFVDADALARLRTVAESKEFQSIRKKAASDKDEKAIENYLKEKGVWEDYFQTKELMCKYLNNMDDIKYLYIIVLGDSHAFEDMYLVDDYDNPLYRTGEYESREPELKGVDTSQKIEPTISSGRWGYLCSAYVPVYDQDNNIVCHIGCDVDMETIVNQKISYLLCVAIVTFAVTAGVLVISIMFVNNIFAKPIKLLTDETKKFNPEKNTDYKKANVIDLYLKNNDEISDIHDVIRSMQKSIIDYLNDMSKIEKDKQHYIDILRRVESDAKNKKNLIDNLSKDAYYDELTKVGNKNAYVKKVDELQKLIEKGTGKFAIAMIDLNNLKFINDYCGHEAGDIYITGSCAIITSVFKHSSIFRVGGDEFVVIMIGEDYRNRDELVEKVRESFSKSYYNTTLPPHQRYSASVGLAVFADGDVVESVFKRADQAMYADKMLFKMKNGSYR